MRRRLTHRLVVATSPKTRDSPLVIMFALFVPCRHQNADMDRGKLSVCKLVRQKKMILFKFIMEFAIVRAFVP